ncbi:acetylcholine receptor subunit alpha-like 1 isoform X2 [Topomyia yanbarensis]|uniref:acetylcholine receptor subunit alpha-like 1 isoform X2 n=1 Tax=Topomyia yanbarensis TaxID=2498891 RepID=UPI00273ADDBD|nr:acetylcholine receptor subunit alpha-like 1 isoform X2 [Topomyia yanbarensis]
MGKGYSLTLAVIFCLVQFCYTEDPSDFKPIVSQTWADKLKKDLLANYDRNIRPAQHYNVTNVDIKMTITHVDIDEETSIFSVYGWVKMDWSDDKLRWNPANYGNLDVIRIHPDTVWKPDLVLYNNARGSDNLHYGNTNILLYNNGKVLWVPPTDYHGFCELNLRLWPFDYQTCFLKIGSWTYDGYTLNLTAKGNPEIIINVPNNEWSIHKVTTDRNIVYYACCTEPYIDVQYNITLQRHSSTHKAIVISPAFVIMLLALSVFWLPPHCGEKIILNGIIVLIVTVFLIYFAQQLPAMSGNTPLIVNFFSTTLYLVAFSTIISIIVLRITRTKHFQPVPKILKNQADGCLGSVLGVNSSSGTLPSDEDKEAAGGENIGDPKQRDWCRVATLIDRLFFVIYLIIFIISIIYYSL